MDVIHELRKLGRARPPKAEPIPVTFCDLGIVGHIEHGRGLYINSALKRHVKNILRDDWRAERAAREISGGRFGAGDLLPIAALGSDSRDAIRAIKGMTGAISSFDNIINARTNGKVWDFLGSKASQTTVAANWSSFLRTGGVPGAMTFNNIPGPAALDSTTVGAWPLPITLGATENLYLTNFGTNHATGSNVVMLVDVLQAAGNILTSLITSQSVVTTTLTRWTGGAGLAMTLEVTVAPGTSTGVPNITIEYVDQSGAASTTGAITEGVTSPAVGRLVPLQDGPFARLASGDFGVRSITSVQFSVSSAGAGGAMAAILFKPLVVQPTIATNQYVERSTPALLSAIRRLTSVDQGSMPALGFFVLTSTTSTGAQTYFIETIYG